MESEEEYWLKLAAQKLGIAYLLAEQVVVDEDVLFKTDAKIWCSYGILPVCWPAPSGQVVLAGSAWQQEGVIEDLKSLLQVTEILPMLVVDRVIDEHLDRYFA